MQRLTFSAIVAVIFLAACGATNGNSSSSQTSASPDVVVPQINRWRELNSQCRGGPGNDPATLVSCSERDSVGRALEGMGWCHGRKNEYGYQMEWHQCEANSVRLTGQS